MTRPDPTSFLSALDELASFGGVSFRGCYEPPQIPNVGVVTTVLATSRNPLVAIENRNAPAVMALLNRTGRDLSVFSAHLDEEEILVRPGSL